MIDSKKYESQIIRLQFRWKYTILEYQKSYKIILMPNFGFKVGHFNNVITQKLLSSAHILSCRPVTKGISLQVRV